MKTSKRRLVPRRPGPPWDQRGTTTSRGVVRSNLKSDMPKNVGYAVSEQIRNILENQELPATARMTAARTLAEIEGLIGRHQVAPIQGTTAPLSSLSRDELIGELDRLRTAIDLGIVR